MLFPVGGDVRFIDGKETLVFSGSQKAIRWLNKVFAAMHESSTLPTQGQLQKYARRSTSAPSRTLGWTGSPGTWGELSGPQEADLNMKSSFAAGVDADASRSPPGFTPPPQGYGSTTESDKSSTLAIAAAAATAATAATANGFGSRARKARGGSGGGTSRGGAPTMTRPNLSRQKKNFLRGKRQNLPSPPTASTISSRAKSCEKVRPKSSGTIFQQRSCRNALPSPVKSAPGTPAAAPVTAAADVADGRDSPIDSSQTFPVNPVGTRTRFCERPNTAAEPVPLVLERGGRKTRPVSCPYDRESTPPRQIRMERSDRLRKMSTSPFSSLGRMSSRPSSAVRKNRPTSTATAAAFLRQYGNSPSHAPAPSKPKSTPEMLHQQDLRRRVRPATPSSDRPGSPPTRPLPPLLEQQLQQNEVCNWDFDPSFSSDQVPMVPEHEPQAGRTWAYADTLLSSRVSELERVTDVPAHNKPSYTGQESCSSSTGAIASDGTSFIQPGPGRRRSPPLDEAGITAVVARPATPISPDFLRSATAPVSPPPPCPDEESLWRLQMPVTAMSTPSKRYSKSLVQPFKKATTAAVSRQERKPLSSTVTNTSNSGVHALHSLAYPDVMESTLKQLSSATRKFMSKMAGLNNKLDGPGPPLPLHPHPHPHPRPHPHPHSHHSHGHGHGHPAAIICQ